MRRKPELQHLDLASWPSVAWTELTEGRQQRVRMATAAIERYARGDAIDEIELSTGIDRRQLYRWLYRALQTHPDGRIWGFRAVIPNVRIAEYARVAPIVVQGQTGSRGTAGAISQIFESHPALVTWLRAQIRQRKVVLHQVSTDGKLKTRLRGLKALHEEFLKQCRSLGLKATDYPLCMDYLAIRSLSNRLKAEMLRSFGQAARAAGASHLKGLPLQDGHAVSPAAVRPYQVVEFDGHRLDVRLKVVVRDPLGFEHEFEMERIWLLVIIDVCTRAILGYHVVLAREYSRHDVIKTMEKALEPHRPMTFTLPNLAYSKHDGLPSQKLPELAYACWEWIKLGNAKANLANDTLSALCEFVGCIVDAGPYHHPDERPYIERFFATIAQEMSSRLPGYTGSHPRDLRRALSDPKGNLRLYLSSDELTELVEYAIASYNGTPHSGLNNITPLEAMERLIRVKQSMLSWLAEHRRRTLCLMQTASRHTVRAYLHQGVRPHINLHGVRYTSTTLAAATHLIGTKLLVYSNVEDLRGVRAFLADGAELGPLQAQGAWGLVPHDLRLRKEILKWRKKRGMRKGMEGNVIEAFVQEKLAHAKHTRKAATDLAHVIRVLSTAPTIYTPLRPTVPISAPLSNAVADDSPSPPPAPGVPRRLTIGTGLIS